MLLPVRLNKPITACLDQGDYDVDVILVQTSFPGAAVLPLSATTLHGNANLKFVIPSGCGFIDFSREVIES
jgi:hypothetical protein